jgi:hypothetical protein
MRLGIAITVSIRVDHFDRTHYRQTNASWHAPRSSCADPSGLGSHKAQRTDAVRAGATQS